MSIQRPVVLVMLVFITLVCETCCMRKCPIDWKPNPLGPVFYGVSSFDEADGAPGKLEIFFPSLEESPTTAPLLRNCCDYPLIVLLHGMCVSDSPSTHYLSWVSLPSQLARAGYVVIVPSINYSAYPWAEDNAEYSSIMSFINWTRENWVGRGVVMASSSTGVIGHSYGALLGARFAKENPDIVAAYVSIAGVWQEWTQGEKPIQRLTIPKLFSIGTNDWFTEINQPLWDAMPLPKHKVIHTGAEHWDYLEEGKTSCGQDNRGQCSLTRGVTMDIVTMFFGKYLPPEHLEYYDNIPVNLVPPTLNLSAAATPYAGEYMENFGLLNDNGTCEVQIIWNTNNGTGTVTR